MDTVSSGSGSGPASGPGFRAVLNPLAGTAPSSGGAAGTGDAAATGDAATVLAFHRRLPGYEPTPLLSLPGLASRLGVRELLVKVEGSRFGLPAFKLLGASWATYRAVSGRLAEQTGSSASQGLGEWADIEELAHLLKPLLPFRLAAATDGNHGRAVARMARWLGFDARVFVPGGTTDTRVAAIESEGAEVAVVDGSYDEAVERASGEAGPRCLVVNDTSGPGYVDVPRWVAEGYGTMFVEVDDALARAGHGAPDVVVVPIGVGALAAATVSRFANGGDCGDGQHPVHVIGVEPTGAACVTASALAGRIVTVARPRSIMAGLNCDTPSSVAWPLVSRGVSAFVTIDDDWAREAVRALAACGVQAGETGGAALGGLMALQREGRETPVAGLVGEGTSVLVLVTEGPTDLVAWRQILGAELVA
ncbi:MAG: diaminopropionate ammonia-lyase [Acidimicrobiales bacterium]